MTAPRRRRTSDEGRPADEPEASSGTLDTSGSLDGMVTNFQHTNVLSGLRETNDALAELQETHEERLQLREQTRKLDVKLVSLVAAAREYGISWQQIGAVLGISKQAAWERFGRNDPHPARNSPPSRD